MEFWVFLCSSKIFSSNIWDFIRNSWLIAINYCFLSDFFSCFRHIEDLFWFCASFLWILKIYLNFERSYGSFWTLWNVLDLVSVFMYLFWTFRYCRDLFWIVHKDFFDFWVFLSFLRFFLGFLGTHKKFVIYS